MLVIDTVTYAKFNFDGIRAVARTVIPCHARKGTPSTFRAYFRVQLTSCFSSKRSPVRLFDLFFFEIKQCRILCWHGTLQCVRVCECVCVCVQREYTAFVCVKLVRLGKWNEFASCRMETCSLCRALCSLDRKHILFQLTVVFSQCVGYFLVWCKAMQDSLLTWDTSVCVCVCVCECVCVSVWKWNTTFLCVCVSN